MRLASVDSIRLIAILAVIAIHTRPFADYSGDYNSIYYYLNVVINQLARFAVPFFFAISGYFYGIKIRNGKSSYLTAKNMLAKLIVLYLGWCIVYFMPYNLASIYSYGLLGPIKVAYWNLVYSFNNPLDFIFQGSKDHLWFLVSLILCVSITALFLHKKATYAMYIFAIVLYVIGVLGKSYADTDFGLEVEFNTRNGPFFGLLLFVTGYWLSSRTPTKSWFFLGGGVLFLGIAMHFSEIFILMKLYQTPLLQDYVFGTYLMGLGAVLISLSNHEIISNRMFATLGKMTLGIYASHFIFVDLLRSVDTSLLNPLWDVLYVILVFGLSLLLTKTLAKFIYTRRLVE